MHCRLCALTLVLLLPVTAHAERLPIRAYTTADGLAHSRVTCVVADSRGFIWLCGPDGLSRFDGQGFTTYGVPQGLGHPRITDFLETSSGVYWVSTNGGGVYRFNPVVQLTANRERSNGGPAGTPRVTRFTPFQVGPDPQTNRVNVLHEDRLGRLWAGTDGGLYCLDSDSDGATFRRVDLDLFQRPDLALQVWAFAEDREGGLWIGTSWGLVRRFADGRIAHSAVQPSQGTDHVRALLADREDRIWVGHDSGLLLFRAASDHAERLTTANGVSGGVVRSLMQSSDGHVWIGTWDGLTEFDGERFRAFTKSEGVARPIALAEDHDGNIWMGTLANGALRLARNGFTTYSEADGLLDPTIGAVFQNASGELHVVSVAQRIHRFDGRRFIGVRPNLSEDRADPVNPGLALQDRSGEWWIPGAAGLYRFAKVAAIEQLGRVQPKAIYTTRDGLAGDDVFRLFEDSRGDIWIGRRLPTSSVVTRWERATGTFHQYSDADGLPAFNRIYSFAEDHSGNVWIGFQNGGVVRYRHGHFTLFTPADHTPAGGIGALHVDTLGRLWVGSRRPALSRVDVPAADRPEFVPSDRGLSIDGVGSIAEDRSGRLYLVMDSRIDRLDPSTGEVRHYTAADGLTGSDLTAAFRDRDGSLWFGSYNGVFRLVPGPDRPPSSPVVLIGKLDVAGQNYLVSDLGQGDIPRFTLEPAQNQLRIEFFVLGGEGAKYQYRLEGADRDWSPQTDQREVNYASLSPGRYRFVVRALAAAGTLSQKPATVEFTILPPVWQRGWFQAAAVLVMFLVAFAAHRYRVARLVALERVRMRIAADLHDDIGGSLSRISIQSEVARREASALGEQPVRRLEEIANSARRLVDALGDVVWSVDPRKDDLASVLRRLREYADDVLLESGVRWTYSAPSIQEHVKLDPQARRNLFLLLKEAITNVARHAAARSVRLEIAVAHRELRVELRDDGRGFDAERLDGQDGSDHQGLASMRARAARLGGSLRIDSSPASGTTLSLRMPLGAGRMIMLLPGWRR